MKKSGKKQNKIIVLCAVLCLTATGCSSTGLAESKDVCSCSLRVGNRCIALIQVVLIYFGSIRSLNGNCCALLLIRSPGNIIIRYRTLALGQIQLQLQWFFTGNIKKLTDRIITGSTDSKLMQTYL